MLFVDKNELNWQSVFTKWILMKDQINYPENLLDCLEDLCEKWIEPIIKLK
jgi:hypothetical protein